MVIITEHQMMNLIRGGLVVLVAALGWAGLRSWAQGGQVGHFLISKNDDHDYHYGNDAVNDDDDDDGGEGGEQRSNGRQGGCDHWGQHWNRSESSFTSLIYPLTENTDIGPTPHSLL